VWHNLVYRNADFGLLIAGVTDVRVYQNTFYAPEGDAIHLRNAASNVEVRGNIIWTRSGYGIYVANDSQTGFFSDYNNLYADQGGRIGYWTRDFVDILDWQADIARFDLHSIGATVVNPLWARPQFLNASFDDYRLFGATAGLRFTSPDVEAGDARLEQAVPPHYHNLLTNPGFEAGFDGWAASTGAVVKTGSPAAYDGAQYFSAGTLQGGQVEQTVNLLAAGFDAAQLDAGLIDLVFGGRSRSAAEAPADRGWVTLEFYGADNALIATFSADALNVSDRWELVGGRAAVPGRCPIRGARFSADRQSGSSNDAWFDQAFLYAVSEAYVPDLGAYGHGTHEAAASSDRRILLRFPDHYTDWEQQEPIAIRWETVNNSTSSPVRIELLRDTAAGPERVLTIAAATADDGEFTWIPGNSGIDFGTHGLRIQVSLVHDALVLDRSQEPFSVPEDGDDYYVDDGSNAGDQYTPDAVGSNRHTGKTAQAPKPNPVNLLREYKLDSFSTVYVDAGDYPMIYSLAISGTFDLGLGLEEGFRITGPTDTSVAATLRPAIPGDRSRALIELNDADFVTIEHLSLRDADRGLYVHSGSDAFSASWITAWGHRQDGIRIETSSPFSTLSHLTAYDNSTYGIYVSGAIGTFSHGLAYNNGSTGTSGILIAGSVREFTDNVAYGNRGAGFILNQPGNSQILRNESYGNGLGMSVFNTSGTAWVGSLDLDAGDGNRIYDNSSNGLVVSGEGVHAVGNAVWGHRASGVAGITLNSGAQASYNLVYGNFHGIRAAGVANYNRVYDNIGTGIITGSNLTGNIVYSNAEGIVWSGSSSAVLRNNLVYDNTLLGLSVTGLNLQVVNNTIVQDTGNGVSIDSARNIRLYNNVLWTGGGYALAVSSLAQDGFDSDYNLFYTVGPALVGQWQGSGRQSLNDWRTASFTDANSLYADPLFVNRTGTDGVMGYVSLVNDGRDDDFHLQSRHGSSHGGALAPVRDAATGLPVMAPATLTVDAAQSPGIDRGRANDAFSLEPVPNGGYINIGAYGGTAQASLSPAQYVTVLKPIQAESAPQDRSYELRWRSFGFDGPVDIDVSADNGATWTVIADGTENDGSHLWYVDSAIYPLGDQYLVRVSADVDAGISDTSEVFRVVVATQTYYVNVAGDSDFSDNEFTTAAGSDVTNDGLAPDRPMASIRAVLDRYNLEPGDVILVDAGVYLLTTNIVIGSDDSGVVIRGASQPGNATILDRGNTASDARVFQFAGADDVTLDQLTIRGGYVGVYLPTNTDSDRITISNSVIQGNSNWGVLVEQTNDQFQFIGNRVHDNGVGLSLSNARGARIAGNEIWGQNQQGMVAFLNMAVSIPPPGDWIVVENNRVFDNGTPSLASLGSDGIVAQGAVFVRDNEAWGQGTGVRLSGGAIAEGNDSWGNTVGIRAIDGAVRDNRVWANSTGLQTDTVRVQNNVVFGNAVGVQDDRRSVIANNLVYGNSDVGIRVRNLHDAGSTGVLNNTVHQVGGRAIEVVGQATNVSLRNNILWSDGGIAVFVDSGSQVGFRSDFNLFALTDDAELGWWEDRAFASRAEWYYETGFDGRSLAADPQFADPWGTDAIGGWDPGLTGFSRIVDNGDPAHAFVGNWTPDTTRGFAGDFGSTPQGDGSARSVWTFADLEPGYYRVAVTWPGSGPAATNAKFTSFDGAGTVLSYQRLNQNGTFVVPNDFNADGAAWENVGLVRLSGDTLVVELSNFADGAVLADAVRIDRVAGDFAADDDYRLLPGSPAIDRGSLGDYWVGEREPSGGRIDLGAYGNTASATLSADPLIQVLSPNGLEKLQAGQSYRVDWRSAGLTEYDVVALINAGSASSVDNWLGNAYQTATTSVSSFGQITINTGEPVIDRSGVVNPAPEAVYRSYATSDSAVGSRLAWTLPADAGDYLVRLHFMERNNLSEGDLLFDILVNGVVVAEDFDIIAAAGAPYTATIREFSLSLNGGEDLQIELVKRHPGFYSIPVSAIEVLRANPAGVVAPTVDLELSVDNGVTWSAIAEDLAMDRFGRGSYDWTPDQETVGNTALIRVTGHAGDTRVSDLSDEPFLITNNGAAYYVNVAGDSNFTDNEYTTAPGDNANSGKTPDAPMASLAALLRAYDLGPGDIIYVDSGLYELATNIVLEVEDSGVTIQGPQSGGNAAIFDRGNTAAGRVVFELNGADDVTLSHLVLTGGQHGILATSVDSDNILLSDLVVHGHSNDGISIAAGNDFLTLRDSLVYGNTRFGVSVAAFDALLVGNTVTGNAWSGITVTGLRTQVLDNVVAGNGNSGIEANLHSGNTPANSILVDGNRVFGNSRSSPHAGISAAGRVLVANNEVSGEFRGIVAGQGVVADGNAVWGSTIGLSVALDASAIDNRVWSNGTGILVSNATVQGNRVYGNTIGIHDENRGRLFNNLVYDNATVGIRVTGTHTLGVDGVVNNTVQQSGGRAIEVLSATNATLRNNILSSDGGVAMFVDRFSQTGFSSDYNLFRLTGAALFGTWEDVPFANRADWYYETGFDRFSLSADPRFIDVAGVDGVVGWDSDLTGFSRIIDVGQAGHAFEGDWTRNGTKGYGGDFWQTPAGDGSATSTWTFAGLESGYYRIAVTWPGNEVARADTLYTVRDSAGALQGYRAVSANTAFPNDFTADGATWETIGIVRLEGDALLVELTNAIAAGRVMADAVRIDRIGGDFGADDDFGLQIGSPAIDRGSLIDYFLAEPQPNGGRVDLGAFGGTQRAALSTDPSIQVLNPNGLEKIEAGQAYRIDWRSAGLTPVDPIARINAGANVIAGDWLGNAYQTVAGSQSTIAGSRQINLLGAANPAPDAVYRSYATAVGGIGNGLAWTLPVDEGDYLVRLHFVEPSTIAIGGRRFDILLNGQVVADDYDIQAAAGGAFRAVVAEFPISIAADQGLLLELINQTAGSGFALISGIELLRVNADGVPVPTADLEVSVDGGATWAPIASGLTMDRDGRGSFLWTPDQESVGNSALIRVTGHAGPLTTSDISDEPFLIANGGNRYYINVAGDGDFSDNEYTTAAGDNANSGKTPDAPMASLAALLRAYDLDAGDIVYVDTGIYNLATNIVFEIDDSGVTVQGPQGVGHVALLNRGNTAAGRAVFQLNGADDVTLAHLAMTGGQIGIVAAVGVDSDRIVVRDSAIFGHSLHGIQIGAGSASNDDWQILDNLIHGNASRGIDTVGPRTLIQDNEIFGNSLGGINVGLVNLANRMVIRDNEIRDNGGNGVQVVNSSHAWIVDNRVHGHTGNGVYGLSAGSGQTLIEGNEVFGNTNGISAAGSVAVIGNEVYRNSQTGIGASGSTVVGNRVYGNSSGIVIGASTLVSNNVVYANTNTGVLVSGIQSGVTPTSNNTVYHQVGDAIRVSTTSAQLYNNLVWIGSGYGINSSVTTLQSDYNLIFAASGSASTGLWANLPRQSLADWRSASGRDLNSVGGDPLFIDIDGADNVFGSTPSGVGSGHDDNFGVRASSPAIDAAYGYRSLLTDIEGRPRSDDPATPNTGDGFPLYVASDTGGSLFAVGGNSLNVTSGNLLRQQELGFGFTFYGTTYTAVGITTEGYLRFGTPSSTVLANTLDNFLNNVVIAPFWDNLTSDVFTTDPLNIFVDTSTSNQITIRWAMARESATTLRANFSVTLFSDGTFRFDYGPNNTGFAAAGRRFGGQWLQLRAGARLRWRREPGIRQFAALGGDAGAQLLRHRRL
jgi:parallel beta-helix repeat protein